LREAIANSNSQKATSRIHAEQEMLSPSDVLVYKAAGDDVLKEVRRHQPIKCSAPISLYPRQLKPPKKGWTTLLNLLQYADVQLGPWLPTWHKYRKWHHVFTPLQGHCWVRDEASWTFFLNPNTQKRKYQVLDTTNVVNESTCDAPDAVPIDLLRHQGIVHVYFPQWLEASPPKPPDRRTSFVEFLRNGPE
jgi:hypothetical protein